MVRHASLLLLAAPFLALGIPSDNIMRKPLTNLSRLTARRPIVAWLAGVFTMWLWHLPILYNAHLNATGILSCAPFIGLSPHNPATAPLAASVTTLSIPASVTTLILLIHDPSLLLAGFVFCWPLVTPYPSFRLPTLHAILYLATACITCSLLGLLITYAPQGMYRGVTLNDQQSGGLIMWVPCCFLYLSASMWLLIRWLSQKESSPLTHS
jgi:cytochrome c oxidase assembly factor CtaG